MAQQSHIPKFGNWDNDNIPYTAFFENARKEKGGGVKMNPNDPEDNPEAFMCGRVGIESDEASRAVWHPVHLNSIKSMSMEKHHLEEPNYKRNPMNASESQKTRTHRSLTSESSSDKSNSEDSHHKRSKKKSILDSNSSIPSSHAHDGIRNASDVSDEKAYRPTSMPKFGEWDERDPQSGEGFTIIFNKLKREKQIADAKFPTPQQQPSINTCHQKQDTHSKVCCCLFRRK
ncbi:hypothetical protein NMG60_11022522 [Bertholletia excelsa]